MEAQQDEKPDCEEDVLDPHVEAEERKREMEDEMSEDEMQGLRGGWEDYVRGQEELVPEKEPQSTSSTGNKVKRERSPEVEASVSKKKRSSIAMFGAELVKTEQMRELGLSSSTISRTEHVLGSGSASGSGPASSPAPKSMPPPRTEESSIRPPVYHSPSPFSPPPAPMTEDGRLGWACLVCTFVNLLDHGRCGGSSFSPV